LEELPVVSLFGQVWLWSLLSFVAGVLLTWLVLVRPAKRQVGELEDQLTRTARPARQQPVAAAPVSSPMRDDEFDDWHVESRNFVDDVLVPEPPRAPEPSPQESHWPSQPARPDSPLPAENQWPSQPGRPEAQRPPEQQWPSQPQPPRPLEQQPRPAEDARTAFTPAEEPRTAFTPAMPVPETKPEPPRVNDSAPAFEPIRAFDNEPEPEDHDYDELPPALTRIPEPAEPPRIVEPVEVPEEEKPRSLFERVTPDPEVQAEPVPLHPAEEAGVFQRSELDELPNLPEIPAADPELPIEQTQFMPVVPATAEIAPRSEEPTAPPEVGDFRPREMWREEEEAEPELEPVADVVHEDELLEDDSEDDSEDFVEDLVDEVPVVEPESAVEETSVIATADVEAAIAEGDARAAAEAAQDSGQPVEGSGRESAQNIGQAFVQHSGQVPAQESDEDAAQDSAQDAAQKAWPDHDLPGERIASSQGSLGLESDDPDDQRDDPDEEPIAPAAVVTPPPPRPVQPAPAPAPAAERPRSLFEPVVGETDEDELPKEQPRNLPPSDDQPFVPKLAPSLLERSSNGLPQRPQRPAGQSPMSPPLLSPSPLSSPKPPSPPAPQPLPARPRPVGFSPTTDGRSDGTTPRYQQAEGFNPRSPFGPGSVLPRSDGLAPAADFEVKATLTGRRYFTPESANFHETRADVWFRTTADAQKAGFREAP
jgi:hypothetical protein